MTAPRVLFVKLSSLGDVIHNLPAVTDLAARRPEIEIAWAVEPAYGELVALHPAVSRVLPVPLRELRSHPLSPACWSAMLAARRELGASRWDYIVDTQGLVKSAIVAHMAHGVRFGLDRGSAREPFSARWHDQPIAVTRNLHAVERNRALVAAVFGYEIDLPADYGISTDGAPPAWAPADRYYVALHATSRADKQWPEERWVALAQRLRDFGLVAIYPGGNAAEREAAARLCQASPGAMVAPGMSLVQAARLLGGADGVVGVDTGLTHLAVALGRPTVGLYVATDPALTGLHGGERAVNLGGVGEAPGVAQVLEVLGYGDAAQ